MISTTAEYALRIMILLTESHDPESADQTLTSEQIASLTCVPADYAVKVLQWLGRANLVRGRRGRGGGFRLACDPNKTTLLDVVMVIDPLKRIHKCPLERSTHSDQLCPLHQRLDEILEALESSLRSMTLVSVCEGDGGPALCVDEEMRLSVLGNGARSGKRRARSGAKTPAGAGPASDALRPETTAVRFAESPSFQKGTEHETIKGPGRPAAPGASP